MAPSVPPYRSEAFAEDFADDPAYDAVWGPARPRGGAAWFGTLATLGAGLAAVVAWFGLGSPSARVCVGPRPRLRRKTARERTGRFARLPRAAVAPAVSAPRC